MTYLRQNNHLRQVTKSVISQVCVDTEWCFVCGEKGQKEAYSQAIPRGRSMVAPGESGLHFWLFALRGHNAKRAKRAPEKYSLCC
jgi:hypothetical protein